MQPLVAKSLKKKKNKPETKQKREEEKDFLIFIKIFINFYHIKLIWFQMSI